MKAINVAELKTHLSKYLRLARAGESFIVLDRREPVAELTPLKPGSGSKLDRLVREGRILPATKKFEEWKLAPLGRDIGLQQILDQVRGDVR